MKTGKTAVVLLLSVLLLGCVIWGVSAIVSGDSKTEPVLALASFVVGGVALLISMRQPSPIGEPATREEVEAYAAKLVAEVKSLTASEVIIRGLQEDQPDPVSWRVESMPAAGDPLAGALPSEGDLIRLIDGFVRCGQRRRMVVIGDAGSGKSSLSLLLALALTEPVSSRPVPVLLPMSSWEPGMTLRGWISHRLVEEYPFLGPAGQQESGVAVAVAALFDRDLILPVFDGLDELTENRHVEVLAAINADVWSRSFVLTCRTKEFTRADARLLNRPLVVRLLPVDAATAARYLADREDSPDLTPLLSSLADDPQGAPAAALSTPFMLFLARTQYAHGSPLPAELIGAGNRQEIESHLISAFIPTVFGPGLSARKGPWDPARAEKWLAFVAAHLRRLHTTEFAWWELHRAIDRRVSRVTATVLGGLACTLLGTIMFGLFGRPWFGLLFGLATGVGGANLVSSAKQEPPRQAMPSLFNQKLSASSLLRSVGFGAIGAVTAGLIVAILYDGIGYVLFSGLVFGFIFGIARLLNLPAVPKEAGTPDGALRNDRTAVLYGWGLGAVAGLLVGGFLGSAVGTALAGGIRKDLESRNAWILTLETWQHVLLGAGVGCLLGMAGLGMTAQASSALGRFTTTRLWLWLRGHTPLRFMTFLREAYKRGILRRAGPFYQFRHELLYEHLLREETPEPVEGSPPPTDDAGAPTVTQTGPDNAQ